MLPVDGLTFISTVLFTPGISPAGFYWSGKLVARSPTGRGSQQASILKRLSPQIVSFTKSLRDTSVSNYICVAANSWLLCAVVHLRRPNRKGSS